MGQKMGHRPIVSAVRTGSNYIDIEVSRHHAVSVSNFQNIKVLTNDRMVNFLTVILAGLIRPLHFRYLAILIIFF